MQFNKLILKNKDPCIGLNINSINNTEISTSRTNDKTHDPNQINCQTTKSIKSVKSNKLVNSSSSLSYHQFVNLAKESQCLSKIIEKRNQKNIISTESFDSLKSPDQTHVLEEIQENNVNCEKSKNQESHDIKHVGGQHKLSKLNNLEKINNFDKLNKPDKYLTDRPIVPTKSHCTSKALLFSKTKNREFELDLERLKHKKNSLIKNSSKLLVTSNTNYFTTFNTNYNQNSYANSNQNSYADNYKSIINIKINI